MYRVGLDVGGTFTDFTVHAVATGRLFHHKVASTPADPSEAIAQGLAELIERLAIRPDEISFLGHGTTVATNMVIERRGAPTGLLTTPGFRDVIEIARQTRPELFDYSVTRAEPLVPRELRIEVAGRFAADGRELAPLDEDAVLAAADRLARAGVRAIAVCFLHAYLDDAHERRAAELIRARHPGLFVSTSAEVLPEFREYERCSTTIINGYVGPHVGRYVDLLIDRLAGLGLTVAPYTIHSNGGLMSAPVVRAFPVRACLSGPAAGVVGAAETAAAAGFPDAITFDVGGTSTDVSLIEGGRPTFTSSRELAGHPVRTPMVDVNVIGAGGGSVAFLDDAGALKVGPRSVGADPGPISYGRGGTEPTLTDANIVLHRLDPAGLLKGRLALDEPAARRGIEETIARPLGLSVEAAALGIIRIAASNMSRAIRAVSTQRGYDLERFALIAYGGAGPLHASAVARECGMSRIIVPVEPGTMCARGILMSDASLDFVKSRVAAASDAEWPGVLGQLAAMAQVARAWFEAEAIAPERRRLLPVIEARYRGQNHEIQVPVTMDVARDVFLADFAAAHRREFGHDIPGRAVEVVNCRLRAVGAIDRPASHETLAGAGPPTPVAHREVYFDAWYDTPVFERASLPAGCRLSGPAVINEMSSTTLIAPGEFASVDPTGNIVIEI